MAAVRWEHKNDDIVVSCELNNLQVASMTNVAICKKQSRLIPSFRLNIDQEMLEPLSE